MKNCICKVPECGSLITTFYINKKYKYEHLNHINKNRREIKVYNENQINYVFFYDWQFETLFHTEKEYRKLKLLKLNNIKK